MPTYFDPTNFEHSGPDDLLGGDENEQIRVLRNFLMHISEYKEKIDQANQPVTQAPPAATQEPQAQQEKTQSQQPPPADTTNSQTNSK